MRGLAAFALCLWALLHAASRAHTGQAASQMPGIPVPFDSALSCCTGTSLLPKDQYVITAGQWVYLYDPIMQRATRLYDVLQLFLPPVGTGINLGGVVSCTPEGELTRTGGEVLSAYSSATWWRGKAYVFLPVHYLRWKPHGESQAGLTLLREGWSAYIDGLDSFLTSSMQWSYAFVQERVVLYNNQADMNSHVWLIEQRFPGLPLNQDDSETELGRGAWAIWRNNSMWLYHPEQLRVLPGWPRPIHEDEADGGTFGVNRTRCSGTQELSTVIGFWEDKSPGEPFRSMQYAPGLRCNFVFTSPANLVKQQSSGVRWTGIHVRVTRFHQGEHAQLYLLLHEDMPSDEELLNMSTTRYAYDAGDSIPDDVGNVTHGPFRIPEQEPVRRVLFQWNKTHPPPMDVNIRIAQAGEGEGEEEEPGMSFSLRFETAAEDVEEANPGTGAAVEFALATPTPLDTLPVPAWGAELTPPITAPVPTYSTRQGLFWFSSMHEAGTQRAVVRLPVQAPEWQSISFNVAFQMYPNDQPELWERVNLTVRDWGTGALLQNCSGSKMFVRGYESPRCAFTTPTGAVLLEWTVMSAAMVASVMGEWVAVSYCNKPASDPHLLTALRGWVTDESGPYNRFLPHADCHWTLQAEDPSVLFIILTFWEFDLDTEEYDFLRMEEDVLPPGEDAEAPGGGGLGDAPLPQSQQIATLRNTLLPPPGSPDGAVASIHSSGTSLRMHFYTGPFNHGTGFNASYRMVLPPIPGSLRLLNFAPAHSDSVSAALRALGSAASVLVYAGVTTVHATVAGVDKYGESAQLGYQDWFRFILRFIPVHCAGDNSALLHELQHYPSALAATNSSLWHARGFSSVTSAGLSSIFEYELVDASLRFVAPVVGGVDYHVSLVYVLKAHAAGREASYGMRRSGWEEFTYTMLPYEQIIRVTAFRASPTHSSFFRAPALPSDQLDTVGNTLPSSANCTVSNSVGVACNANNTGANGAFSVSAPLRFTLVTRDAFANQMEGLSGDDDVRAFLRSATIADAPPTILKQVTGGEYSLVLSPIAAANDYTLTVMVSGSDVFEGPFQPQLLPAATDAAACTLICESTGLSLLTYPLPLGDAVPVVLTLRDRFGNPQLPERARFDAVSFVWDGYSPVLEKREGATLLYKVRLGSFDPDSILRVTVNSQPLGYNPDHPAAARLRDGIHVVVGTPVVSAYEQPEATQVGFIFVSCLFIVLTLLLAVYMYICRQLAPIRAAVPQFLLLMLVGASLLYASLISQVVSPATHVSCALDPFLGHLGFLMLFGALFVKAHRVRSVERERVAALKKVPLTSPLLTENQLMARMCVVFAIFALYYILWMSVARPEPMYLQHEYTVFTVCRATAAGTPTVTNGGVNTMYAVFPLLILAAEILFVLYGAVYAAHIWALPSAFQESRYILIGTYNVAVLGGLFLLLVELILESPDLQLLFSGVGILVVTFIVTAVMFGPKLVLLWSPEASREAEARISETVQSSLEPIRTSIPSVIPEGDETPHKSDLHVDGHNGSMPQRSNVMLQRALSRVHVPGTASSGSGGGNSRTPPIDCSSSPTPGMTGGGTSSTPPNPSPSRSPTQAAVGKLAGPRTPVGAGTPSLEPSAANSVSFARSPSAARANLRAPHTSTSVATASGSTGASPGLPPSSPTSPPPGPSPMAESGPAFDTPSHRALGSVSTFDMHFVRTPSPVTHVAQHSTPGAAPGYSSTGSGSGSGGNGSAAPQQMQGAWVGGTGAGGNDAASTEGTASSSEAGEREKQADTQAASK